MGIGPSLKFEMSENTKFHAFGRKERKIAEI